MKKISTSICKHIYSILKRKRTMSHKYMNSIKCVEQWAKWESGFFLKTIKRKVLYSKSELSCIFRGTKQILLKNSLTDTQILKPQLFYSEHDLSVIFLKMPFFYFFCGKRNKNSNPYVMINDYYSIQIMRARERGFVELKGFRRKHGEACRNI